MKNIILSSLIVPWFAGIPMLEGAIVINSVGAFGYSQNFNSPTYAAEVSSAGTGTPIAWSWTNDSTYVGWSRQVAYGNTTNAQDKDFIGEFTSGTIRFGNMGNGVAGDGQRDNGPTTDRALGLMMQGIVEPGGNSASFGLVFEIGAGLEVTAATVGYNGEQWFRGAATANDRLDFQYKILNSYNPATFLINAETGWTDVNALDFTAIHTGTNGKLDGNVGANRAPLSSAIALSASGSQFIAFRWTNVSDSTNAQAALAVDDLNISFSTVAVPEPSVATLALLGAACMLRRSRQ